jgi:galactan beta-1,4-galactosyltransferase
MSAYRGGTNTFAIIGLASKPLHVYGKPRFKCEWIDNDDNGNGTSLSVDGYKILPDWGYGRVYTVVVVNCTFDKPVGLSGSGGKLVVHASTNGGGDREVNSVESFVAIEEQPGTVNGTIFTAAPDYDYLYCGSPLYGNLSPQRVRYFNFHMMWLMQKIHMLVNMVLILTFS